MGSIKNMNTEGLDEKIHTLTESEFNYVVNMNSAKQEMVAQQNRVLSAFLHYIASSRLGYASTDDLQFEVDFSNKKHELKIQKLPKFRA